MGLAILFKPQDNSLRRLGVYSEPLFLCKENNAADSWPNPRCWQFPALRFFIEELTLLAEQRI